MKQIPMLDLKLEYDYMKADIDSAISKCLNHQQWILGPEVKELEEKIAAFIGSKYCIGTSSGTDALVLALRALAIKIKGQEYFEKSDKIITTPFTFTATGDAILRSGATPVFVDIIPDTFNIDPARIKKFLAASNAQGVVGIIPVHLFGQACNMDEIMEIAGQHNLFVLEDVAQAFGAMWQNQKLGSIGIAGAFSFFPSKNLGGFGDGGMITTNDDKIAEIARMLLKHGGKDKYNVDHIGYNARLDTLQAAIVLAKLKYVDEFNEKRRKIAEFYTAALKTNKSIELPVTLPDAHHVYHQYTIKVPVGKREALQKYLTESCISSMVYYPVALHKMKVFKENSLVADNVIISEKMVEQVLSLPVEPLLHSSQLEHIVTSMHNFFNSETTQK